MYNLSQRLLQKGHKVIIITHSYQGRTGVRYLSSCVKVYYIPHWLVTDQVSLPTVYSFFPLLRQILIREEIDIVHGHAAFSSMALEAIMHAKTMGLKAVFTDHSLFGFQDTSSILMNKLLKFTLSDIDHVICVSHTSKENTVLRASLNPLRVSVIPNAVVAAEFTPDPSQQDPDVITIVVASRLAYRKGADLLVTVIPKICDLYPNVNFLIAGDGPKRVDIEQMREHYILQDRVTLLGALPHHEIRNVLVKGQIFLNTSLTEAFCIAIVEAASCGLLVVSTDVGGIPEVLPKHMIVFAKPNCYSIVSSIQSAISRVESNAIDMHSVHNEVTEMYSWSNVADRTEIVYDKVMKLPHSTIGDRLVRYYDNGLIAGKLAVMIVAFDYIVFFHLGMVLAKRAD